MTPAQARRNRRNPAIAFLGGGRITAALVAGLRLSGYADPIVVCDRHASKLRRLQASHGVITERSPQAAITSARIVFVAVRPASVAPLLRSLHPIPGAKIRPIFVSLAAGLPLARLRTLIKPSAKWVRAMPSPVSRAGQGLTALAFDRGLSASERRRVRDFFARMGPTLEIPERQFNSFTVAYSSSHGYHALSALAGAAIRAGLDPKTALGAAAHALADGIIAWRNELGPRADGRASLRRLLNEAATPAGIAAKVMSSMDRAGYSRMVRQALRAGISQAKKASRA